MGGPIAHHERDRLTGADVEFTDSLQILAAERHRRAQDHSFGAADGRYPALRQPLDPRHHGTVVEAQDELGLHRDTAAQAPDQPDDVGEAVPQSDEIDHLDCTLGSLEHCREDQRAVQITALDSVGGIGRRNQPTAVLGLAEKRCKTGCRIEPRQTEPVDGSVAPDQRRRSAVADQRIIFDPLVCCHDLPALFPAMNNAGRRSDEAVAH